MDLTWVTGAVVVAALIVAMLAVATYGILDVARLYRGEGLPKPPTASNFVMRWWIARPLIPFLLGLTVGIFAAHFGWYQLKPCP